MKISVILTSYNHEEFIGYSIESILNQTYKDFEFIIVDDCSSDSSWEIISDYKKRFPDIITLKHSYNWGGGTVEDTVKTYASGDYIAIHHSDDIWEKDKLQKQIEVIQGNPKIAAVFTNAMAIDDRGKEYSDETGFYYNLFSVENRSRQEWLNHFFYNGNCLCHPSILIKKDIYEENGFFRKGLQQIPDFVKWIQLCKYHEIYILPDKLVSFRIHDAGRNTSGMRVDTQVRSTIELHLMLNEYLDIRDKNEFLRIFPEANEYCAENFFSLEYSFGRICTKAGMPSYTRIFGIQLLYQVLNDTAQANIIANNFNYTMKDFMLDNGKHDIFGILPSNCQQKRTVYIDSGNGYNIDDIVSRTFYFMETEQFQMNCIIEIPQNKIFREVRFDPVENIMVIAKLSKVSINGISCNYIGDNALSCEDDNEIFINLDPIYKIFVPEDLQKAGSFVIVIEGYMKRLTEDDITKFVMSNMYKNRDIINNYQGELITAKQLQDQYQIKNQKMVKKIEHYETVLKEKNDLMEYYKTIADEYDNLKKKIVFKLYYKLFKKSK